MSMTAMSSLASRGRYRRHASRSARWLMTLLLASAGATHVVASPGVLGCEPPASAGEVTSRLSARAVGPIGISVRDLDASVRFYSEVLGFTKEAETEVAGETAERLSGVFGVRVRSARLRLGRETIELSEYLAPEGRPIPIDSRSNDRWFQHIAIVVTDMEKAYSHLRAHRVRHASAGPQTLPAWNPNAGGISAFYFKDPDGHVLEVIHFPPGKGDPRWQESDRGALFLGIDHTAIVVHDTERALGFYRDVLGLRVAGGSENHGIEQERLNNVFGARLRITTLRAAEGPGVELLEYLAPSDGRDYPADARANDLVSWTTTIAIPNGANAPEHLRAARVTWVSAGMVVTPEGTAARVRDPDGHVVILTAPTAEGATSGPLVTPANSVTPGR